MRTKKILRNTGLLAASGVVALALAMVPAAPGLDAGFFGLKAAQAKGNGGNGNGGGNGGGNANGHGKGANVSSDSEDAHGKTTGGHAKGKGNGHSTGATTVGGQGITATTVGELRGNLNAYHASVMAFKNAAPNSMVGQIKAAITEKTLEVGQKDALQALSNQPVDEDVLDAVRGIVSEKVDAAAAATVETEESEGIEGT